MTKLSVPVALACLLLAHPARAAPAEFTSGRVPAWEKSTLGGRSQAVQMLYLASVCFAQFHRANALALLESERGSQAEADAYDALIQASNAAINTSKDHLVCFINMSRSQPNVGTGRVRFSSPALLRGAIAEAFYNRVAMRPRGADALPLAETYATTLLRWPEVTAADRRERVGRWTALCAAHAAPRTVHKVLAEAPASIGETRALKALEPALLGCLPDGQPLLVERLTMRTLLAEGLWRASRTHRDKFINA